MITKPKRGGKRQGSGRKKGSGTGRKVKTLCICLSQETLAAIDKMRGKTNRSAFIRLKLSALGGAKTANVGGCAHSGVTAGETAK